MSSLNKEQIYKKLKSKFDNVSDSQLREVSYNLSMANVVEANIYDLAAKSLERLQKFSSSLLSQQAAKIQANDLNSKPCPICKIPMVLVNLMEGRQAHYCSDHKIVEPLPVSVELENLQE